MFNASRENIHVSGKKNLKFEKSKLYPPPPPSEGEMRCLPTWCDRQPSGIHRARLRRVSPSCPHAVAAKNIDYFSWIGDGGVTAFSSLSSARPPRSEPAPLAARHSCAKRDLSRSNSPISAARRSVLPESAAGGGWVETCASPPPGGATWRPHQAGTLPPWRISLSFSLSYHIDIPHAYLSPVRYVYMFTLHSVCLWYCVFCLMCVTEHAE